MGPAVSPFPSSTGQAIYNSVVHGDQTDAEQGWYSPPEIKPRDLGAEPRCYACKSGPMFHLAHRWGPCQVKHLGAEEVCGCTVGVMSDHDQPYRPPDPPSIEGVCFRCGFRGTVYPGRHGGHRCAVCFSLPRG